MNVSFQLFQLQHIDSEIDRHNKRIKEIQTSLDNNVTISSAEQKLESSKQVFIERSNAFNQINDQIEKKKIKRNQSQSTLYSGKVQNPKELEDLQYEISSLEKSIKTLEESLMQALIDLDESENNLESAKVDLKNARSEFATESALLNAEKEKLLQQVNGLKNKRSPLYKSIQPLFQNQYETLRKRKNGIAVTSVNENSCGACGANLTASQIQAARTPIKLFICPNCSRIIYGS